MIKKLTAAILFAAVAGAPAFAGDVEGHCEAYAAENGVDASGCACLGEAASSDAALAEAILAIASPEDVEAADDATKEAIRACFPESAA